MVARVFWKKKDTIACVPDPLLFCFWASQLLLFPGFEDKEKTKFSLKKFSRITHIT